MAATAPTAAQGGKAALPKSHYSLLDTADVKVIRDPTFGATVVHASDINDRFIITTAPMLVVNPVTTMEGTLGQKFKDKKGQEIQELERYRASFKFGMGIGGEDDVTRRLLPDLKPRQFDCSRVIYQATISALGSVFDARPPLPEFAAIIEEKRQMARTSIVDGIVDQNPHAQINEDMIAARALTDPALAARVDEKARRLFVQYATYKLPNPDDYDADGNIKVKGPDGRNRRYAIYMKRKVWGRKDAFSGVKQAQMPIVKKYNELPTRIDTWPAILADVSVAYEYSPFRYIDMQSKKALPHPMIANPQGAAFKDPSWSPLRRDCNTLVETRLFISVFTVQKNYGVKVTPFSDVTIIRQSINEDVRASVSGDVPAGLASGLVAAPAPPAAAPAAAPATQPWSPPSQNARSWSNSVPAVANAPLQWPQQQQQQPQVPPAAIAGAPVMHGSRPGTAYAVPQQAPPQVQPAVIAGVTYGSSSPSAYSVPAVAQPPPPQVPQAPQYAQQVLNSPVLQHLAQSPQQQAAVVGDKRQADAAAQGGSLKQSKIDDISAFLGSQPPVAAAPAFAPVAPPAAAGAAPDAQNFLAGLSQDEMRALFAN